MKHFILKLKITQRSAKYRPTVVMATSCFVVQPNDTHYNKQNQGDRPHDT